MQGIRWTVLTLALGFSTTAAAQTFSIGLRGSGGFPIGSFAEQPTDATGGSANSALIQGAKAGFGYGLDVGFNVGMLGLYAGFDAMNFDCDLPSCTTDAQYQLRGASVGVKLMPQMLSRLRPFVKAGVTFNSLEGSYGGTTANNLSTDRPPGFEIGAGASYSLGSLLSLTPQVRYVGQKLNAKIPGVTVDSQEADGVNYLTFGLGLSFSTPFGSSR